MGQMVGVASTGTGLIYDAGVFFYFSQIDTPSSLFLSVFTLSFTLLISLPLRVLFAHAT